jgi:5-methylcytosine-specific restriction enzyme A
VPLSDVTRDSVVKAMQEYDQLGREAFLARYGYGQARRYLLVDGGKSYDSKAIVGVAHGYATGRFLRPADFTGGDMTVGRLLIDRGFTVHRSSNPDWEWEEVVLACDLVVENNWHWLDPSDGKIQELSALLRRLPLHHPMDRGEKFRNINGVSRKTADIATQHPDYEGRPTNGGTVDRKVLAAFLRDPDGMHQTAVAIRATAAAGGFDDLDAADPGDLEDIDAPEGKLLVRRHLTRERSRSLRDRKIRRVRDRGGKIACEVCGFDFGQTYGVRGAGYIECHHVVPLHAAAAGQRRMSQLPRTRAATVTRASRPIHS